jgi:hypothetical protein
VAAGANVKSRYRHHFPFLRRLSTRPATVKASTSSQQATTLAGLSRRRASDTLHLYLVNLSRCRRAQPFKQQCQCPPVDDRLWQQPRLRAPTAQPEPIGVQIRIRSMECQGHLQQPYLLWRRRMQQIRNSQSFEALSRDWRSR